MRNLACLSILHECFLLCLTYGPSNLFLAGPHKFVRNLRVRSWLDQGTRITILKRSLSSVQTANAERPTNLSCGSSLVIDPGVLSVDSGRIRYVLKEKIGKIAA